jgi:acetoin utilization deacetylase AcuC-like enzyme
MDTTFYYHPVFLEHDTGSHPERRERLEVILSHLRDRYGDDLEFKTPRRAEIGDAAGKHVENYLEMLAETCRRGGGFLDGDTPVSERSMDAALHAVGAVLDGADDLMEGRTRSAFALVRPPGHHARPALAMGFCLINNVAVAADYLRTRHGLERVLIVDFDVHHGNGTEEMFYEDGAVFFLSMHRFPFYPGTGRADSRGSGPGEGKTLNLPIPLGEPPGEVVDSFQAALDAAADAHKPECLLVSAGFDAFAEDPVGGLGLLPEHFEKIGAAVRGASERHCPGRILTTLEGGYSLSGLPVCLAAYVDGLGG